MVVMAVTMTTMTAEANKGAAEALYRYPKTGLEINVKALLYQNHDDDGVDDDNDGDDEGRGQQGGAVQPMLPKDWIGNQCSKTTKREAKAHNAGFY